MTINKHLFIKAGLVVLLVIYLATLYSSDNAKDISMDQIAQSMEADATITTLNKEDSTSLKRYYQTEEPDINGLPLLPSPYFLH